MGHQTFHPQTKTGLGTRIVRMLVPTCAPGISVRALAERTKYSRAYVNVILHREVREGRMFRRLGWQKGWYYFYREETQRE